jgi:hypothetical protein
MEEAVKTFVITCAGMFVVLMSILGMALPFVAIKASFEPVKYHCPIVLFQMNTSDLVFASMISASVCISLLIVGCVFVYMAIRRKFG